MLETTKQIIQLLSGALTPVIAVIAIYIAWRQHKTARDKLKLDLYDRRFKVYRGLIGLFDAVIRNAKITWEDLARYHSETNEKKFLFEKDILDYMTEVRDKAIHLYKVKSQKEQARTKDDKDAHSIAVDEEAELLTWFTNERKVVADRFASYLAFKQNL